MYRGDRSRKETLVEFGFRLPSALDNRPLRFDEFRTLNDRVLFVSATPGDYELEQTAGVVVEQIIRPTGLIDPLLEIAPAKNQVDHLLRGDPSRSDRKGSAGSGDHTYQTNGGRSHRLLRRPGHPRTLPSFRHRYA